MTDISIQCQHRGDTEQPWMRGIGEIKERYFLRYSRNCPHNERVENCFIKEPYLGLFYIFYTLSFFVKRNTKKPTVAYKNPSTIKSGHIHSRGIGRDANGSEPKNVATEIMYERIP